MKLPDDALRAYCEDIRASLDRDIAAMYTPRSGKFTIVDDVLLGHRPPPFTQAMRDAEAALARDAQRPIASSFHPVNLPYTRDQTVDLEGDFLRWSEPKPRTPAREALIDLRRGEGYTYSK